MESADPNETEPTEEIGPEVESETEETEPEIKGRLLSTKEAAKLIGCSVNQVRHLVRKGKLKAKRVSSKRNPAGYDLQISQLSAKAYSKRIYARGWPRGVRRNLGTGEE